jgi:protein-S-isoprenylcysteine O-methyltransferase Ste14
MTRFGIGPKFYVEETWLEQTFQASYRDYRRRIPAVLPLPRFWRSRSQS